MNRQRSSRLRACWAWASDSIWAGAAGDDDGAETGDYWREDYNALPGDWSEEGWFTPALVRRLVVPEQAEREGREGTVLLRLLVRRDGSPEDASVSGQVFARRPVPALWRNGR